MLKFISNYRKAQADMGYIIRHMQEKDILQALEIDREAFPTQWPHPTYASIKQELRNRLAHYIVAAQPTVPSTEEDKEEPRGKGFGYRLLQFKHLFTEEKPLPSNDYLVGVAGFWTMLDEAHIITFATRSRHQRQGIGELLLISIVEMAAHLKANIITLEVRISNNPAQALYQKYGFKKVGLRRRYYTDNGEDAFIMTLKDIDSTISQSRLHNLKEAHRQRRAELYT